MVSEEAMRIEESIANEARETYQRKMLETRGAFEAGGATGAATIAARSGAMDELVQTLWRQEVTRDERLANGVALVAVGGYGRGELFPFSDVDLMFLLDGNLPERDVKDAVRRVNQDLWDCGIRVSPVTRRMAECEKFDPENVEFLLALMDHRMVAGDVAVYERLARQVLPKLLQREYKSATARLVDLTRL